MIEVSTSILSVKDVRTLYDLEVAKTDYFHIDVMDGKFVKNNTSKKMHEYAMIIKQISNLPLDVHLMVEDVEKYVDQYIELSPNIITFHYESNIDKNVIMNRIKLIKENGMKCGISIKPNTKIDRILEFLPYIHLLLVMTVEPGKGGQELILSTVDKVIKLKKYIEQNNIDIDIEVDGGINIDNVNLLKDAGANIIVSGTTIINSDNFKEIIKKLKEE